MKTTRAIICILVYLALLDILVNFLFRYPEDPHETDPSFLQSYFDYGRSVEGKLQWMTRPSVEASAPRVDGGWLKGDRRLALPSKKENEEQILVALYGMSHTEELWKSIQEIDRRFLIRGFMAAGAPPNWSYAAYEFDRGRHQADVAVIGILTDSVYPVTATTGMTAFFDSSFPYTFPRYTLQEGALQALHPPFYNARGYLEYFYDRSQWNSYREWLGKNDKYYDGLLFKSSIADHSAFLRLLRRAYAERQKQKLTRTVYTKSGFVETSEEIVILREMVRAFAASARRDGIVPVVYIVNNQGRGDHLYRVLKPTLERHAIPYLSTHLICPPDDPHVYLPQNSHFTHAKDLELAGAMIGIIEKELSKGNNMPRSAAQHPPPAVAPAPDLADRPKELRP